MAPKSRQKVAKATKLTREQVEQSINLVTVDTSTARPKRNIIVPEAHKSYYDTLAKNKKANTSSKSTKQNSSVSAITNKKNSTTSSLSTETSASSKSTIKNSSVSVTTNKMDSVPNVADLTEKPKRTNAKNKSAVTNDILLPQDEQLERPKRTVKIPEKRKHFYESIKKSATTHNSQNPTVVLEKISEKRPKLIVPPIDASADKPRQKNNITVPTSQKPLETIADAPITKNNKTLPATKVLINENEKLSLNKTQNTTKKKNEKPSNASKSVEIISNRTKRTVKVPEAHKSFYETIGKSKNNASPKVTDKSKMQSTVAATKPIQTNDTQKDSNDFFRLASYPKTRHKTNQTTQVLIQDSSGTDVLEPDKLSNNPSTNNKLKKPLKRLQAPTAKKMPTNPSSTATTINLSENHHHVPIYKQITVENKSSTADHNDDDSIYDYFSNSQDSGLVTTNNDPMHDVIEKLRREKKIYLNRKPKKKQQTTFQQKIPTNKRPKPLWNDAGRRLYLKKNLIDLRDCIENKLKQNLQSKSPQTSKQNENDHHISIDSSDDESVDYQDDGHHADNFIGIASSSNYDNHHSEDLNEAENVANNDDTLIDLSKSVTKTYQSKSPHKSNENRPVYRLPANKPTYQSTPVRISNNVPSSSPWRVEPEQVLSIILNRKNYQPNATQTSETLHKTIDDTPATGQPSIRTDSRKESTSQAAISAGKRLRYTQFELEQNKGGATDAIESSKLNDSMNLSNVENVEPPNYQKAQETITLAGMRKTLPRSPLKSLAIRNIRLSPQDKMPIKHINLGAKKIIELPCESITDFSTDTMQSNASERDQPSIENYFGFDSDIDENDNANYTDNLQNPSPTKIQRQVREKMKKLKKFMPITKPKEAPPRMAFQKRNLFASTETKRQQNLHDIINKSKNKVPQENAVGQPENSVSTILIGENIENRSCSPVLFKSFWENDKGEVKSYSRVNKRKRNISTSYSDNEDYDEDAQKKQKPNRCEKRKEREKKAIDKQFNEFANEFNSMCKSIDEFEILVENV